MMIDEEETAKPINNRIQRKKGGIHYIGNTSITYYYTRTKGISIMISWELKLQLSSTVCSIESEKTTKYYYEVKKAEIMTT